MIRALRKHIVPAVPSVSGTTPLTQEAKGRTEFGNRWLGVGHAHIDLNGSDFIQSFTQFFRN